MSPQVLLGVAVGALAAAVLLWLVWGRRVTAAHQQVESLATASASPGGSGTTGSGAPSGQVGRSIPPGVLDVLAVLESTTVVLDRSGVVVSASPSAEAYGLVRRSALVHDDIRSMTRAVRQDGRIREHTLRIGRSGTDQGPDAEQLIMAVRVAPLGAEHLIVLLQDRTHEERVERVRRDFVANVSHELKTPVGGLSLLAEAVLEARDDPAAVERFATRMQVEARRLSSLVGDIVDLTRLQVADSLHEPHAVDVAAAVREAVDSAAVLAAGKDIDLQTVTQPDLRIFGDEDLIVTAVRNLVSNAVHYSDAGTRVAIRAQRRGDHAEVVVADRGHGIPPEERDRIFERFYRVDPARSRATGGTGLGLSIVKHVCAIHGGTVSLWSQEGKGSTFTIRLPLAEGAPAAARPTDGSRAAAGGADPRIPHRSPADLDQPSPEGVSRP